MDEVEFKGEWQQFDYFVMGLWLFTFSAIAAAPGWLVGSLIPDSLETELLFYIAIFYIAMRISHWLFFPIFFLSSMEAGSMFAAIAKNTIVSLFRQPFAWFRFYLLTGVLFVLADLCLIFAIMVWFTLSTLIASLLFFFLFALQSLLFFRLLGRLAWLLEETDRRKRELEEEQSML